MNSWLTVLLVLGCLALEAAPSPVDVVGRRHHGHHHSRHTSHLIQKCGAHLSDFISEVCRGRGYNDQNSPSASAGSTSSFRTGGIVEECCLQACPISFVMSYCKKSTSPVSASSTSSTASAEYSDERLVEEAHQTNHIRPVSNDSEKPQIPADLEKRLRENRAFAVGTIPQQYKNTPVSVHAVHHRPRSNSVK